MWVWCAAFLALSLALLLLAYLPNIPRHLGSLMAVVTVWGLGWFLLQAASAPSSRWVAVGSSLFGTVLAFLPYLLRTGLSVATTLLAASTLVATSTPNTGIVETRVVPSQGGPTVQRVESNLHPLRITYQANAVGDITVWGGAIKPWGEGFLLVTGEGKLFRLDWDPVDSTLTAKHLPAPSPLGREAFLRESFGETISEPFFRVTGLAIDTSAAPARAFLAHQSWDPVTRCVGIRVSVASLPDLENGPRRGDTWRTFYTSTPCIAPSDSIDFWEVGGQLGLRDDGSLLLTVGDHGLHGLNQRLAAQDTASDYGKILLLDTQGRRTLFSLGHRNPQGLMIDGEGEVWSTEHGPKGGDEINQIRRGGNYGWPLATYGTDYAIHEWPLAPEQPDHGPFLEPLYAFVPSIGISNLVQVGANQFPEWEGDLLVASLRAETLFRVRTRADRATYAEPIAIQRRIRDLAQGRDGRIVLWTDTGDLVIVSRDTGPVDGALVYEQCVRCHGPALKGSSVAPNLVGMADRTIAGVEGFSYSNGLSRLPGRWTIERLDAFLKNPSLFAKGTTMPNGVPDDRQREALIKFLWLFPRSRDRQP